MNENRISELIDLLNEASGCLENELVWLRIETIIRRDILTENTVSTGVKSEEEREDMVQKSVRLLSLYEQMSKGKVVYKKEAARTFRVIDKTIQRDLDDIRAYLAEARDGRELIYDRRVKGYVIVTR